MACLSALKYLARLEGVGLFLYGILLYIMVMGCKIQSNCLKKKRRMLAVLILAISLIFWIYGELRACGFIIYQNDSFSYISGPEHETNGSALSLISASYSIGSMIGLIYHCWKQREIKTEKKDI